MNVEKLERLADTVEKGYHNFDGWNVAFSMHTVFQQSEPFMPEHPYRVIPKRDDLGDPRKYSACGCLMGFAMFLEGKQYMFLNGTDAAFGTYNIFTEVRLDLDISKEQSNALFLSRVDGNIRGDEAARVIRSFLVTGDVNWPLLYK